MRSVHVRWLDPSGASYTIHADVHLDMQDGFDTVEFTGVEDASGQELDPIKFGDRPDFERAWQDIRLRLADVAVAEQDEDRFDGGVWAEEDAYTPLVLAIGAAIYWFGYWRGRLVEARRVLSMTPRAPYVVKGDTEAKNRKGEVLNLEGVKARAK